MYILGGFDGTRRNDMYKITLPEQLPREDKRRRKRTGDDEAMAEPDAAMESGDRAEDNFEASRLRMQVLELQHRLEAELERHLCKICYEREINTVVLDCNHRAVCARCLDQVSTCPLCRAQITRIVHTYSA
eukprot:gnl/TRDRNA2_/TRDRNA2_160696_c2_seq1.p1 gnl/TRDRNA2_/TRDRNA2_160696_c2~~gnl/TRDRNA2_/TRDRNA2_160696_c2_seq1.p1  ORF type:complete len:131 (+),score=29.20 gnl/TRDRNA2_/TRDRNA2_160696_c2_seq1:147-539(+)